MAPCFWAFSVHEGGFVEFISTVCYQKKLISILTDILAKLLNDKDTYQSVLLNSQICTVHKLSIFYGDDMYIE